MLVLLIIYAWVGIILVPGRFAVDLEIPLRAAERWQAGQPPYLASAFTSPPGATQPFLYPPFTLPFLALLTGLPRAFVGTVAVAIMLLAAIAAGASAPDPVGLGAAGPRLAAVRRGDHRGEHPDAAVRGVRLPVLPRRGGAVARARHGTSRTRTSRR